MVRHRDQATHANRLIHETSPYLLQHAHNPVDWQPWDDVAIARSRAEHKPILLSVGYSACHWCHVMAHESFEDPAVAELMNEHFVCIKVDREERPDVDEVYMTATLALNQGQGGWPMTVFLTPELAPIFAGTYFPPTDRWGRPGFATVLRMIAETWRTRSAELVEGSNELVERLRARAKRTTREIVKDDVFERAIGELRRDFDPKFGGFGCAPKFPPAVTISLLLRLHQRLGDAGARGMADLTLRSMARGGLRDHVGGGFHRYSTDERWLVPHFEKMLYDNALLARAYIDGFSATGESDHREVAIETLDFVTREMTSPEGGFLSALDADSEGREGAYYVWTMEQVRSALGDDENARSFCAWYDITEAGNWDGWSIPNRLDPPDAVARRTGRSVVEIERAVRTALPLLREARARRIRPVVDDKVLTGWNGLMIGALAEGARVLREPRYLSDARRAADFILGRLLQCDGRLLRVHRDGRTQGNGFLEDYAYLIDGLIDLHEAGAPQSYLRQALALGEAMCVDFQGEEDAFAMTSKAHSTPIVRPREGHDGATPSANAKAAFALARLGIFFDRRDLRDRALRAIEACGTQINQSPRAFHQSLIVLDWLRRGPTTLVLVGNADNDDTRAWRRAIDALFLPNRVISQVAPGDADEMRPPVARGKPCVHNRATLYVCRGMACLPPVTDPGELQQAVQAA